MLERIPARVWGRGSLIVLVGACIAVVVIGQQYGSKLTACGPNPSPFAQHRQWPVAAAGWVLVSVSLVLFGSCIFSIVRDTSLYHLLHYLSRPLVWLWVVFCFGGGVGWIIIEWFGWTC